MKHVPSNSFLNEIDFLEVVVSRKEVESQNVGIVLKTLQRLIENPKVASKFRENVDIAFHGYDSDHAELFEILEVRDFVYELDKHFPYWLYFLSKYHTGLQCIIYCFLPPYLTEEAKKKIYPQRLQDYLINRGLPAMNHICEFTGCSEKAVEQMTERVIKYIQFGRLKY
ncbi:MAG TPA: hypothetical protein VMU21_07470 [Thermodesulfovibrionales bacterium]|nr:hypothetical protein [Thermodesulfovibrionales bacterium]